MTELTAMVRRLILLSKQVDALWTLGEYEEIRNVLRRLETLVTEHDAFQEPKG